MMITLRTRNNRCPLYSEQMVKCSLCSTTRVVASGRGWFVKTLRLVTTHLQKHTRPTEPRPPYTLRRAPPIPRPVE